MTNSDEKRESAVMISSAMPSAIRVPTHVLKRQNGDGWPVRKRGVRGTGGNGKSRGLRRNGDGTLLRDGDRADEPIASSGQGLDPILAARLLPKHPT